MTESLNRPITPLVDSHAHLDGAEFDADRAGVIERARASGLRYLLLIGGTEGPEKLRGALDISEPHDWIFATAGIHPHEAAKATDRHLEELCELAKHPKMLGLGEIGLDYYYDHSPRETQKPVLIRQFELARELKLPVIIHCRDAWADLREMVKSHWTSTGLGGILHGFTGERQDAFDLMDSGFLVSFAGNLTFKKAENLRVVAREVPLDRLLTETDCPYLAPVPHRGTRNEPAYVREVTRQLSELHSLGEEEMGRRTVENFERFFDLPQRRRGAM